MLVREVAATFPGRVKVMNEDFGRSPLAERFGVVRYPAVFVDDVLIAKPKDFGFYGNGGSQGEGRYVPWKDAASHERFRKDLARMIELALAGRIDQVRADFGVEGGTDEIRRLPEMTLPDLGGDPIRTADLAGRVVLVELWAPWCPPCRSTLDWIQGLNAKYGDRLAVLALAVESKEEDVRMAVAGREGAVRWAMATPEAVGALGDVTSIPTLMLFAPDGTTDSVFYGAPDGLHDAANRRIEALLP